MTGRARLTSLAVTAALLSGCGGGGGGSGAASGGSPGGHLAQASAYVPSAAGTGYMFEFADWSAIEHQFGVTPAQLSGQGGSAFFEQLQPLATVPAGDTEFDLAAAGGDRLWSASNMTWDASVTPIGSGSPVNVTGFQPQFDLAAVGRRLAGCGFTASKAGSASLYSGSTAAMARCAGPFGDQVPNGTAFGVDAPDHTVLVSDSAAAITAALGAQETASTLAPVLGQLGHDQAVAVGIGPAFCSQLSDPIRFVGRFGSPAVVARAKTLYPPATSYTAFGFGLALTRTAATGQIVFTYSDPHAAQAALADREHRLSTGISLLANVPYSKLVRFQSGRAAGQSVVLQVGQPAGGPIQVGKMFTMGDLGFARCG
jgi:hypothetical protein